MIVSTIRREIVRIIDRYGEKPTRILIAPDLFQMLQMIGPIAYDVLEMAYKFDGIPCEPHRDIATYKVEFNANEARIRRMFNPKPERAT